MYKFVDGHLFSFLLSLCHRVGFLGQKIILCFIFWGTALLFFKVAPPFYVPAILHSYYHFAYLISSLAFVIIWLSDSSHPTGYEVVPHCGFDLALPDDYWCLTSFHLLIHHLYILEKCQLRSLAHFTLSFYYWVMSIFLIYSGYESLIDYMFCNTFSGLSFHFLDDL